MCQMISGVAVLADGELKVYTSSRSDSHTDIREEFNIRDDGGAGASRQTPVELIPIRGVLRIEDMDFKFDDRRPDWWTDEHTEQAKVQLFSVFRSRWNDSSLYFSGSINLRSLTSLPANAKLSAGGDLDLGSLTSLPANAKLSAGGYLDLGSLTSLPANAKLSAGGDLYLRSLTSLPANAKLSAGGYLYLGSLTSLPAGETLESIRKAARERWEDEKAAAEEARKTVGG